MGRGGGGGGEKHTQQRNQEEALLGEGMAGLVCGFAGGKEGRTNKTNLQSAARHPWLHCTVVLSGDAIEGEIQGEPYTINGLKRVTHHDVVHPW